MKVKDLLDWFDENNYNGKLDDYEIVYFDQYHYETDSISDIEKVNYDNIIRLLR